MIILFMTLKQIKYDIKLNCKMENSHWLQSPLAAEWRPGHRSEGLTEPNLHSNFESSPRGEREKQMVPS